MRAVLVVALLAACLAASGAEGRGGSLAVEGKIVLPEGARLPPETEVQVRLESGRVLVTYPADGGRFSVPGVPEGVHTLHVYAAGWFFPAVKLVTGVGLQRTVTATLPEIPGVPSLPYPLLLRPSLKAEYFEVKKPFNLVAFVKTPYGMMAAFMVFSMFVLPRLKVDPEEYRRVMGSGEQQGGSSGSGGGRGGGSGGERSRRD